MKRSNKYWEARSAQRMYDYMERAEETSKKISEAYYRAAKEIEGEIQHIFSSFSAGISEAEARRILKDAERIDYNALRKIYNEMPASPEKEKLMKQLDSPAYKARMTRLEALKKNLEKKCQEVYKAETRQVTSCLKGLATEAYYRNTFDIQQGVGIGYSFAEPDTRTINQMLANKWSGEHYSKRIWGDTQKLAKTLEDELMVGFMTGKSVKKMSDTIMERFAVGSNEARRLVRTESNYVANQAEMEAYEEVGIEKYRFVATLDNRTSETCQELDGKVFPVKEQQPGVNCPPMHPFCRSTTIAEFEPEVMSEMTRRARDPETGKTYIVPANMTYKEWRANLQKDSNGQVGLRYDDKFFMGEFLPFDKNADYSVKLDGVPEDIQKSVSEATKEVCRRGGEDSKEHLILVDAHTGEHSYVEDSRETSSVGGRQFWEFIKEREADEFICVHNHPVAAEPSSTDLTTLARTKNITASVVAQNDGLKYVYQSNGQQMPATPPALLYEQRKEVRDLTQLLRDGKLTPSEHTKRCEELYIKYITEEYTRGCVIEDGRNKRVKNLWI